MCASFDHAFYVVYSLHTVQYSTLWLEGIIASLQRYIPIFVWSTCLDDSNDICILVINEKQRLHVGTAGC